MLFASLAHAEKTIPLEDNSLILGEWKLYAETPQLHLEKKMVQNKWNFRDNGFLTSTAYDPRLDGIKAVNVKYSVEDGVIKKQIQPGREKIESCKVVKLEGDNMTLHCKYLYYLLKR
ncbi:conserved hypothetical protein [Bathymodiolus platifrons methanotrophic gill symbiont]|nr:hypothetical protein BMR02_01075 [Methylococcaceae bacterium HT1]TXL11952.1 hypothetical protein BMR04_15850 [Methylococcaceae bacterium HT3]TXL17025.1 hypothetical protein BMR04_07650 [Methylococcaceae bacterium HT3]GAW85781.1 conserved hypothetical protein [Bathymodiolus platifrons methanotrophic gill symbiont]GFO74285.1 hypothetical protein BPLS_P0879 [Bathymodiolus platifrons methanotrophic gill symbiont]